MTRDGRRHCKTAVCGAGGVASVASLVASGPHLAITAPAVAALRLMVDGCAECAAMAVSAGAVAAIVDLLGQTTDPELLEATLTVRHMRNVPVQNSIMTVKDGRSRKRSIRHFSPLSFVGKTRLRVALYAQGMHILPDAERVTERSIVTTKPGDLQMLRVLCAANPAACAAAMCADTVDAILPLLVRVHLQSRPLPL